CHRPLPPSHTSFSPLQTRPPPRSTLFPYTTLFRSSRTKKAAPPSCATSPSRSTVPRKRGCSDDKSSGTILKAQSAPKGGAPRLRSEEHTSELQSRFDLVCRLLLEKKKEKSKLEHRY